MKRRTEFGDWLAFCRTVVKIGKKSDRLQARVAELESELAAAQEGIRVLSEALGENSKLLGVAQVMHRLEADK